MAVERAAPQLLHLPYELAPERGKTALLLRHRNTAQLWRSYFAGLKPKADAEAYFAILPGAKKDAP